MNSKTFTKLGAAFALAGALGTALLGGMAMTKTDNTPPAPAQTTQSISIADGIRDGFNQVSIANGIRDGENQIAIAQGIHDGLNQGSVHATDPGRLPSSIRI